MIGWLMRFSGILGVWGAYNGVLGQDWKGCIGSPGTSIQKRHKPHHKSQDTQIPFSSIAFTALSRIPATLIQPSQPVSSPLSHNHPAQRHE